MTGGGRKGHTTKDQTDSIWGSQEGQDNGVGWGSLVPKKESLALG